MGVTCTFYALELQKKKRSQAVTYEQQFKKGESKSVCCMEKGFLAEDAAPGCRDSEMLIRTQLLPGLSQFCLLHKYK